jgi:hypothetical protein
MSEQARVLQRGLWFEEFEVVATATRTTLVRMAPGE